MGRRRPTETVSFPRLTVNRVAKLFPNLCHVLTGGASVRVRRDARRSVKVRAPKPSVTRVSRPNPVARASFRSQRRSGGRSRWSRSYRLFLAQIGKVRKTNPRMRPARARPRLDRDRPRPPIVGHAKSSSCPGPRRGANNAGSSSGHVSARRSRRPPRFVQMRLTCFLRPHSRVFPQATPAATERS